ncbi:beta-lactamase [Luteimonas sp. FCS-9]|nr:beta-lactamase [Luteimonas sp. FCS-9]
MRVHHLNCISTCPLGGRLMDGRSKEILGRGHLSCHCLLVETPRCLVLVDTGLGLRDVAHPHARLSRFFLALLRPEFREQMTAVRQIQRLGFQPADVRHILLSHLDFDHAGGLDDFPHATVHLLARERAHAARQRTWLDRQRFRPQQWSTRARWRTYPGAQGEPWMGFDCVRGLDGLPPELLLVPLPGHTHGHTGIAVDTGAGWKLLAADAYFHAGELDASPHCPPGLRAYQWMMELDRDARLRNQQRLRDLARTAQGIDIFCSHDVAEFERLSGRSARVPAAGFAMPD